MSCCSIPSGCGIPVTGSTGTSVAAGHVLVDLTTNQMPIYVDTCKGDIYYWDGTKWVILGKDDKFLLYDAASRVLTLQPDGSSVQLPLASSTIAGLVKVDNGSPISTTTDGTLVIDCAALKVHCSLIDKSNMPSGNVIYYNTTTNMLDVDCAKLKMQCGLLDKNNAPTGNVIYYNSTTNTLDVNCATLKQNCNLASVSDLPVSGPVVKIDPTSKQLQVDCGALKTQCNLATTDQIPTVPTVPTYNFGQQASLNGTVLHIANAQDPAAGVDVDLNSLIRSSSGGGAENYLAVYSGNVCAQTRTKLGTLQAIEIVANRVWNGYTGEFVPAVTRSVGPSEVDGDTRIPMDLSQLVALPVVGGNQGRGYSLYCKIFEGGIILHYSEGSITNSDVCGAPFGMKIWGFEKFA